MNDNLEVLKPLTEEQITVLNRFFSVIAEANGLTVVRKNIYEDKSGQHYHLNAMGFHTANQHANFVIPQKEAELDKLIRKYQALIEGDVLGKKSVHKVNKIISRKGLTDKDKIKYIYLST
jgi:hypothetical protein